MYVCMYLYMYAHVCVCMCMMPSRNVLGRMLPGCWPYLYVCVCVYVCIHVCIRPHAARVLAVVIHTRMYVCIQSVLTHEVEVEMTIKHSYMHTSTHILYIYIYTHIQSVLTHTISSYHQVEV